MQIRITFGLQKPLTVPLWHAPMVQALIYGLLRDNAAQGASLHDSGYDAGKRRFALFCFAPLEGNFFDFNGHRTFTGDITLEIRSVSRAHCLAMARGLAAGAPHIGNTDLAVKKVTLTRFEAAGGELRVRMLSPLAVRQYFYEGGKKRSRFLSPYDGEFARLAGRNFEVKYSAFTGEAAAGGLRVTPLAVTPEDRDITMYKDAVNLLGYRGEYLLQGEPALLEAAYDLGLGIKNTLGFGVFRAVDARARIIPDRRII